MVFPIHKINYANFYLNNEAFVVIASLWIRKAVTQGPPGFRKERKCTRNFKVFLANPAVPCALCVTAFHLNWLLFSHLFIPVL
jgi:hypothetical protein